MNEVMLNTESVPLPTEAQQREAWAVRTEPRDVPTIKASMGVRMQVMRATQLAREHQALLTQMSNYWIDEHLTHVVDDLRAAVPLDCQILRDDLPSPAGLVVFNHPLAGTSCDYGVPVIPLSAVSWVTHRALSPVRPEGWRIARGELGDDGFSVATWFRIGRWLPSSCHVWGFGESFAQLPEQCGDDLAAASSVEDLQVLLATVDLLRSKQVVELTPYVKSKRNKRERGGRQGRRPDVVIASIRGGADRGKGTGRSPGVRFYVRPHYRQQPCGPERKERRRILVPGHWKGPEGAPIHVPERIHSVTQPITPKGDNQ